MLSIIIVKHYYCDESLALGVSSHTGSRIVASTPQPFNNQVRDGIGVGPIGLENQGKKNSIYPPLGGINAILKLDFTPLV